MARFDVYGLRGGLVVDCQTDMLTQMPTRFVVPLEPPHASLFITDQLNPYFKVADDRLIFVPQLAGTVRTRDLERRVASLNEESEQYAVQRALDLLMTGV